LFAVFSVGMCSGFVVLGRVEGYEGLQHIRGTESLWSLREESSTTKVASSKQDLNDRGDKWGMFIRLKP
jgi:hypothetical protein